MGKCPTLPWGQYTTFYVIKKRTNNEFRDVSRIFERTPREMGVHMNYVYEILEWSAFMCAQATFTNKIISFCMHQSKY